MTETQMDEIVNQLVTLARFPPSRVCEVRFGTGINTYKLMYNGESVAVAITESLKELVREAIRRGVSK